MKVNVYDFDGTIYYGDCSMDFVKYCYKKKEGKREIFLSQKQVKKEIFGEKNKTNAIFLNSL